MSRKTKKALFYQAEPRSQNRGGGAKRGKTKLFWSPGTIWPPCDKGEFCMVSFLWDLLDKKKQTNKKTLMFISNKENYKILNLKKKLIRTSKFVVQIQLGG